MRRDFQTELQQARPIAARLDADLTAIGLEHKAIDVELAGMLALVESPDGIQLGDMIGLGDMDKNDLLRDARHALAVSIARTALGIKDHGHFNHIQEIMPPGTSVANWMAGIWFDYDKSRYAIIGEYIQPIAATPGWRRSYSVYQVKADGTCDVQGCHACWYEQKVTRTGYFVHVCRKHQDQDPHRLSLDIHRSESRERGTRGGAS
jgi:hypothetical protein